MVLNCRCLGVRWLYTHPPRVPEALCRLVNNFQNQWFLIVAHGLLLEFLILKVVDFPILVTVINLKFLFQWGSCIFLVVIFDVALLCSQLILCHRELNLNLFLILIAFLFRVFLPFFLETVLMIDLGRLSIGDTGNGSHR